MLRSPVAWKPVSSVCINQFFAVACKMNGSRWPNVLRRKAETFQFFFLSRVGIACRALYVCVYFFSKTQFKIKYKNFFNLFLEIEIWYFLYFWKSFFFKFDKWFKVTPRCCDTISYLFRHVNNVNATFVEIKF